MKTRRQGDENTMSSVAIETMNSLANSSYGYQIMNRSRHNVTKYINLEKTHSAVNSRMFKRVNLITDQLFEVEMVKPEYEHRKPMTVDFLFYIMLNRDCLQIYYLFFKKFCDTDKYEELEMETECLYLALSE